MEVKSSMSVVENCEVEWVLDNTIYKNCTFVETKEFYPGHRKKNVHLIGCRTDMNVFAEADNIIFDDCEIKGFDNLYKAKNICILNSRSDEEIGFLEEAENVVLKKSQFRNPAFLSEGKNIQIYDCEFYALNSLCHTDKVNMHSGKFHAEGAFKAAQNIKVLSGQFLGPLAFHYARDVIVYSPDTVIRQLSAAKNSIIIAGSIDEVVNYNPKLGTIIYCISAGKKAAPYVNTIKNEDFEKVNDISEVAQKAFDLHKKMTS